jgi:hypothetical protein
MVRRLALLLLPVPLLFVAGAWASARVAERAGTHGAVALELFAKLTRVRVLPSPVASDELELVPAEVPFVSEPAGTLAGHGKTSGKKAKASSTSVIFVSKTAVLALASSGARPHAARVPATAVRPAGLSLAGVGALGIGVQDGDVLTRAVGQPALSTGAVIQAVLGARARHAPVLEGELWRGGQRFLIRVEQPYLDERRSDANDGEEQRSPASDG